MTMHALYMLHNNHATMLAKYVFEFLFSHSIFLISTNLFQW